MAENDNIIEKFEKKIYDLNNLINIGLSLASNLDFGNLVESILYSCIGQLMVDRIAILLQIDLDLPDLYIHMAKGYDQEFDSHILLHQASPLRKYFEENPVPVSIEQLRMMDFEEDLRRLDQLHPSLLVPMKSKNSLNGLLILGNKILTEEFSDQEKEFIQSLAKFAAIAVENSRLYRMAILDRMTHLYIHHYFKERLIEELHRSRRNNTPLSLIMADIDHFKNINDTYGHQQGDDVLKKIAFVFKNYIRNIDIPARYGGEEFALILPNTGISDSIIVAYRLKNIIEAIDHPIQEKSIKITTSFGVAQFNPEIDKSEKDLIKRADAALYKAKEQGRNRVVIYE